MQKILILGAKGMLGQALTQVFEKDKSSETIGWDKEELDIANEKEVLKKIGELKPNIIINAAAYNAVDKCEEDEKEYDLAKKINGLAPGYLSKVAKKAGAVLVHYSSDYVFSGEPEISEPEGCTHSCATCALHQGFQPEIGFWEDGKPSPVNRYGETKLLGEKAVAKNTDKYYILRLSKLFGVQGKSEGIKRSFFDVMLELGKNPPVSGEIRVVDEETACFTYAPDLAQKTKEILEAKKPFGVYHITNSGSSTWYEACVELYKLAKIKTKIIPISGEEYSRPARRPFYSVLLNAKINPMRDWKEALGEHLKSIK